MTTYHIRDLRLLLPPLDSELRVNRHYSKTNSSFREWLQELFQGDLVRVDDFPNHRFDLLCSLCFPTIDPPQLLRVSKLCALTFLADDGLVQADVPSPLWLNCLLNPEQLLRVAHSVRTRQTQELQRSLHASLGTDFLRLANYLFSWFYPSREANTQSPQSGLREFLIVLENTYDHKFSEEPTDIVPLETLWRCTINIVMWSQDLALYSSRHPSKCDRCTVCHFIEAQGFTLQAAVDAVQQNLQSEVEKFIHCYKSLSARTCDSGDAVTVAGAMRDCIIGFVHWIYEGERYFGKQYEEVAKFGWVFMSPGVTSANSDEGL